MDIKDRAELVRELRYELKQRYRSPRFHETARSYITSVASAENTADAYHAAAEQWDRARLAQPKRRRRRIRNAPNSINSFVGYGGIRGVSRFDGGNRPQGTVAERRARASQGERDKFDGIDPSRGHSHRLGRGRQRQYIW